MVASTNLSLFKTTPMMEQYLVTKENYQEYILLYRMGDFYELFFDDALTASKVLGIALTTRGTYMEKPIPMCGIPHHAFDSYIPKLVKNGFKVAVCDQIETPEEAKKRSIKAVIKREVSRIITAGTLTEDALIDTTLNNFLCSIYFDMVGAKISLSLVDISTGEFIIKMWDENLAREVDAFTSLKNPVEIIVNEDFVSNPIFASFVSELKHKIVIRPNSFFDKINAAKNMCDAFGVANVAGLGEFSDYEISSIGAILNYINITQVGARINLKKPLREVNSSVLQMDAFTISNLEIFKNSNEKDGRANSLFIILDDTKTAMGKRALYTLMSRISTDALKINERLNTVEFFINNQALMNEVREVLSPVLDIERIVNRVMLKRSSPRDLKNLAATLGIANTLKLIFRDYDLGATSILAKISNGICDFSHVVNKIDAAIVEEATANIRDGGFIREGYSPTLDNYKNTLTNTHDIIVKLQAKYALQTGISSLKIKYNNIVGYFVEVQNKYAAEMLKPDSIFVHKQTLISGVRFTTDELSEIEKQILLANDKYLALELSLFDELLNYIAENMNDVEKFIYTIGQLDLWTNMSYIALKNNYVKPVMTTGFDFEIIGGRHPVVEKSMRNWDGVFIPNDCNLGSLDEAKIWLLTGPNMAGKSTFLRQNAIIVLMSQMGSFVPAEGAKIGIVNKLFSRVGASDNLARGQSTFMVEMVETATILNQADERSFVILDEIGRGTATFDGLSIAWAVLEYLCSKTRCRGLFATHYHELNDCTKNLSSLSSYTMDISEYEGEVIFLHKVKAGVAKRSYGIHVAKIAGIPITVIQRANGILNTFESSGGSIDTSKVELFNYDLVKEDVGGVGKKILEKISLIEPDRLSPMGALELIYELKKLI